jgi:peptidoglycan/xylan/chitin deacetylase (PgdA/CDA1 family)
MTEEGPVISDEQHRQLGADLFNHTWTLIDKQDHSADEADEMIHTAHASAYHWRQVGQPVHFARSDWQLSRVYALLNRPEAALYHARHSLAICQAAGIGDFDLAFAYEALARASAIGGRPAEAQAYLAQARDAGQQIKEEDDRQYFFAELESIPSD